MTPLILALNVGSSSVKMAVFEDAPDQPLRVKGQVSGLRTQPRFALSAQGSDGVISRTLPAHTDGTEALEQLFDELAKLDLLERISLVGHRIVHGGADFIGPTLLDEEAMRSLHQLTSLAPLHQPFNLAAVDAAVRRLPDARQIGCFDTGFHATQPRIARLYALPRHLSDEGLISYGFHGLSYDHVASVLEQRGSARRTIVAHLGSGASLCAMQGGRSLATTMGFSPLDGIPMASRCGAIDPGLILHLLKERKMTADAVSELLYEKSGLLGVSGVSGDMQILLNSADPFSREAVDLFVYRIAREIGALAATLRGLDTLVFTAGIGENSPEIRDRICEATAWLGVALDPKANSTGRTVISDPNSSVDVLVIPTDEQKIIAKNVQTWRDNLDG